LVEATEGAGRAILAGGMDDHYWDNVALIVFETDSLEQAKRWQRTPLS
jgi:hypothetical protein